MGKGGAPLPRDCSYEVRRCTGDPLGDDQSAAQLRRRGRSRGRSRTARASPLHGRAGRTSRARPGRWRGAGFAAGCSGGGAARGKKKKKKVEGDLGWRFWVRGGHYVLVPIAQSPAGRSKSPRFNHLDSARARRAKAAEQCPDEPWRAFVQRPPPTTTTGTRAHALLPPPCRFPVPISISVFRSSPVCPSRLRRGLENPSGPLAAHPRAPAAHPGPARPVKTRRHLRAELHVPIRRPRPQHKAQDEE